MRARVKLYNNRDKLMNGEMRAHMSQRHAGEEAV